MTDTTDEPTPARDSDPFAQLPPIERKQRIRGGVVFALGTLGTLLLMANSEQLPHGTVFGLGTLLVAVVGLLELFGILRPDPLATPWKETALHSLEGESPWMRPAFTVPISLVLLFVVGLAGGYATLPWAIGLSLLALLPSAIRRPGLLVFVIVGAIYLPLLGTFSLWDPWETHYGEVAREIVSRDDWISLWWAQDGWFWSKPILIFWNEAFWLSAFNVDVAPDANPLTAEWAIRLPVVLFSLAAVMVTYGSVKRVFGTRAGVLASLALATAPHYFLLAHQAITDMYLTSNLVMAMCMLMLAFAEDPKATTSRVQIFGRGVGLVQLVTGGIVLLALPQALYLISRNFTFYPTEGFAFHVDRFLHGSFGNDGVPGNAALHEQGPAIEALQPALEGAFWLAGLIAILFMLRKEQRTQAMFMVGFYVFCALGFMGKGIPGFALPGLIALIYLAAARRWKSLFDGELRVAPGILIVTVIGFPWYIAMYIRHGAGFTDRLLVHDHINRLAAGVHGDTGSIQYFLEQLGPGLFPWVALVPAAVVGWLWMRDRETPSIDHAPGIGATDEAHDKTGRRGSLILIAIWFFAAFTLFSAMITKFHHYIFPAVPPAAILSGLFLDRLFGKVSVDTSRTAHIGATVVAMLAPIALVAGFGSFYGGLRGVVPEEVPAAERQDWVLQHANGGTALILVFLGAAALTWAARWFWRQRAEKELTPTARRADVSISIAVAAGTVILAFVARDLSWATSARPQGYERLIHLFVYQYTRPWPDHFDYRPILTGFGITATVLFALCVPRWTRAMAARAALGMALMFSTWTLDVYITDLADHWGMKNLFETYYAERSGPEEPVIAWQMNWKGENFYTGNHVAAFVNTDNATMQEWLDAPERHDERVFIVCEHSRLGSLRGAVRGRTIEEVTNKRIDNKFLLTVAIPNP